MNGDKKDRHLGKRTTVRPSTDVKLAALRVLRANGWTLNDFVQAVLALVADNPAETLRNVEGFRPPRRSGRRQPAAR
ncbi:MULTISPECIES: hypothetical protein [unclassified Micromonospora]|uniref:hypothetical protein n=1 Tax=unclassified Micromonospora TaxID=2617518 RepID=UPI0033286CDE